MIAENIARIKQELGHDVHLVVVSKFRSPEEIRKAYDAGIRVFAENRVQALLERKELLPDDIQWHLIGHLQTNKVKYIAGFIQMIQSVDSMKLLKVINSEAARSSRVIDCLLQIHIAEEETKFGFTYAECKDVLKQISIESLSNIRIRGLMGMASLTEDEVKIRKEFNGLRQFYDQQKVEYGFDVLSMGMSSDYRIAVECGSNLVRIGSAVFS